MLKRSYPASVLLSALAGFLSVSYFGCPRGSYEGMISSRAHILAVGSLQISESLNAVVLAIFFWLVVVFMSLVALRRAAKQTAPDSGSPHDGGDSSLG